MSWKPNGAQARILEDALLAGDITINEARRIEWMALGEANVIFGILSRLQTRRPHVPDVSSANRAQHP